ncbi:CD63 antigen-like [Tribolium madens]|uniref:CD63 antigen-like n=1 Tax=Tribolium madens TaxID=41895 RepID=UPI001CF73033|nr:CD63 antigen-like [Tribolium madens]
MCLLKECVKFVVLAFNLVFVLVGAALITIGSIYLANFTDVTKAIPDPYNHFNLIPILTIVTGSIIFVISFFGCCGACRNSPCLLSTYAVILLIIFIAQIALGVFAFLEIKNKDDLSKEVNKTIDELFHKNSKADVELIGLIQQNLKCCGTDGPEFWDTMPNKTIPVSCYEDKKETTKNLFKNGCKNTFYNFLIDAARIIGIVVLALSATEVVGATFALCLANSARNDIRRGGYY